MVKDCEGGGVRHASAAKLGLVHNEHPSRILEVLMQSVVALMQRRRGLLCRVAFETVSERTWLM